MRTSREIVVTYWHFVLCACTTLFSWSKETNFFFCSVALLFKVHNLHFPPCAYFFFVLKKTCVVCCGYGLNPILIPRRDWVCEQFYMKQLVFLFLTIRAPKYFIREKLARKKSKWTEASCKQATAQKLGPAHWSLPHQVQIHRWVQR